MLTNVEHDSRPLDNAAYQAVYLIGAASLLASDINSEQ